MLSTQLLRAMITSTGESVLDYSKKKNVLLVFLRHFECVFCRESLIEISTRKEQIKESEVELIFVHMSSPEIAETYFDRFNLKGVTHVSDPECRFYLGFGLVKGRFDQLFGLKNALRGFEVAFSKGVFPSISTVGDGLQMPGIFVLQDGKIKDSFIHKYAADKPDYNLLIHCCSMHGEFQSTI